MNILKRTFYRIVSISALFVLIGSVSLADLVLQDVDYLPSFYATIIGAIIGVVLIAAVVLIKIYKSNKNEENTKENNKEENNK